MLVIYKYKIKKYDEIIDAPVINWLHVDWQEREKCFCAWALVDDEAANRKFRIKLVETGEHFQPEELDGYQYLDSVNQNFYVAHFFVAELNPETLEVLTDGKEDTCNNIDDATITWSSDHLNWLDPDNWPGIFQDNTVFSDNLDWTYRPESEVKF